MIGRWHKALHILQFMRLELVFSAVSNVWLMIFLAWQIERSRSGEPPLPTTLPRALGLGAAVAVGLSVYGLALNDAFDARHDHAFSPHRPIPAGAIRRTTAIGLGVFFLLAAILASVLLGSTSTILCIITAAAILFYNAVGKFLPAAGIVLLGLIRALHMFIPYPWAGFAWPVWLTMSHVMASALIYHLLERKRPRLRAADWWGIFVGWVFWTLALVMWMDWRNQGGPGLVQGRGGLWIGPLIAAALFITLAYFGLRGKMRPLRARRLAGDELLRYSMLWLIIYDAVWLLSAGLNKPGLTLLALFAVAVILVQAIGVLGRLSAPRVGYQTKAS